VLDKFKIFKAEVKKQDEKKNKMGGGGSTTVDTPHMNMFLNLLQGFYRKME